MIDAHRGAFEYDWRTRFAKPLRAVGRSMSWGEALRLTERLATDPSSDVATALSGWDRPSSWQELVTMDLYDLHHVIAWSQGGGKGKRPKPYPRPWPTSEIRRVTPSESLTQDEIIAALRFAGHAGPIPTR